MAKKLSPLEFWILDYLSKHPTPDEDGLYYINEYLDSHNVRALSPASLLVVIPPELSKKIKDITHAEQILKNLLSYGLLESNEFGLYYITVKGVHHYKKKIATDSQKEKDIRVFSAVRGSKKSLWQRLKWFRWLVGILLTLFVSGGLYIKYHGSGSEITVSNSTLVDSHVGDTFNYGNSLTINNRGDVILKTESSELDGELKFYFAVIKKIPWADYPHGLGCNSSIQCLCYEDGCYDTLLKTFPILSTLESPIIYEIWFVPSFDGQRTLSDLDIQLSCDGCIFLSVQDSADSTIKKNFKIEFPYSIHMKFESLPAIENLEPIVIIRYIKFTDDSITFEIKTSSNELDSQQKTFVQSGDKFVEI